MTAGYDPGMGEDGAPWSPPPEALTWDARAAFWRRSICRWWSITAMQAGLLIAGAALTGEGIFGHPADGPALTITGGVAVTAVAVYCLLWMIPPKRNAAYERYGAALRQATVERARSLPSRPDIPDVF